MGEGFKLAERDMAIRGVGTIFGDKQSGDKLLDLLKLGNNEECLHHK